MPPSLYYSYVGLVAGASGVVIGHPLDTMKVHYQINPARKVVLQLGLKSLYRGIVPPLLTSGSIQSLNFTIYEYFKTIIAQHDKRIGIQVFTAATMSGTIISIISTPIGLVKIRQQTARLNDVMPSISTVANCIYSSSGWVCT
jgi:solute carrier family 25 carnitine/acylcarnitine transporter 20/29